MKKSKLSQALIAATVVATLGLTAACSDSGSEDEGKGKDKDKSNGASKETGGGEGKDDGGTEGKGDGGTDGGEGEGDKGGAPALTQAQLKKALVTTADLQGYTLTPGDTDGGLGKPEKVSSDCQVLGDIMTGTTNPPKKAGAGTTGGDAKFTKMISVSLLAYEQADAEKLLGDLRTATKKCSDLSAEGETVKVEGLPEPKAGDEAVAFKITSGAGAEQVVAPVTVVRSGSTLATIFAMPLDGKPGDAPSDVIEAQVKKLESVK
ncbi:hypothetical protein [Streptomyces sp. KLOTTS4A1]|uniref:hypothetical protein n=1 Tax=Streptomyces sp. KLOTTS4A1 TaxID=3390996 RepID=UPI0039F550AF